MLYRLNKFVRASALERAIGGILETPAMQVNDAPWSIVSMVANGDVLMYLLSLKSFYARLHRGKVTAIIDHDMPQSLRATLARHIVGIEFCVLEQIETGTCQRGGTWERLLYILDRSASEYVIQLDSDTLSVGADLDEVVYCAETNTPFTMADGFALVPLAEAADEAEAMSTDYIGIVAERLLRNLPNSQTLRYVRGSSGLAGFSRGGFTRAAISLFHERMEAQLGRERWREWGTEQCASNFAIANSAGAVVLPFPEYSSFNPQWPRRAVKFWHFIGSYRYAEGYYAARGREVVAALKDGSRAAPAAARSEARGEDQALLAFTRLLTVRSAARYLAWRAGGGRSGLWVRLRNGPEFEIRPPSSGNDDYGVAYQIFVHRFLDSPMRIPRVRVRRIVDVGANVGLSCLYWLSTYWRAEVIAFEPHPGHVAQWRRNIGRNRLEARATLHAAAAGTAGGQAWISDAGTSSRILHSEGQGSAIQVLDFFEVLAGLRIDILKIDIEGSEYELLKDPRFAGLDVEVLVLKWHAGDDRAAGSTWCSARLEELGFRVYPIFEKRANGMMWAYRSRWLEGWRERAAPDGGQDRYSDGVEPADRAAAASVAAGP